MDTEDIYLSREGYEKLREELERLKHVRRREISKEIGKAREHGDISENAEYDAAKDAQAQNEKRAVDLEDKLSRARIIDDEDIPKDKALIGATVQLKDLDSKEVLRYTLVSALEADYSKGKISITSPIGQGLLGHKKNKIVEVKTPGGVLRYKILEISR
ncbi:transcription elongation factor GreA [candidate division TA06 bacterium]|nr:transcription elongation factor GreA [candidate division TA06 bacterium]